jgi:sugar phosphate permease
MELATARGSQRWHRLLPVVFVSYSFAYLDRSNYSLSAAGGLTKSLHITSAMTGLLGALFFLGYFFFQIPAARYAQRRSVTRLMFWSLVLWGIFASAQGVIPWLWLLMVDRFLLGVVEAAVIPALLIFLMHWFRSDERGRANTVLILGNPITVMWMSVISGYLIAATSWRWMFIIEGLPAIAWAFVFRALATDWPRQAAWLNEPEKQGIEDALRSEQRSIPSLGGYLQALKSRNVIILAVQYALWSLGVYGFVFWLPTIIKGASHEGIGTTGALSAIPYAAAAVLMLVASRLSDRSQRPRAWFVWPFLLAGAAAFYLSYLFHGQSFLVALILLVIAGAAMYAPYGPYFAYISESVPGDAAGEATALVNSLGALGGFVGAYVVGALTGTSGGQGLAFLVMGVSLLIAAGLMLLVRNEPQRMRQLRHEHAGLPGGTAAADGRGRSPGPVQREA